jgi:chromate transporter
MSEITQKKDRLTSLYLTFFKMGMVTFGGGYAMLPILEREVVEKYAWATKEQVLDFYAVSQGLPGIIAVNVSGLIGYQCRKTVGAVASVLGIVSPCIIIITILAACLANFQENPYVQHALAGISVCVAALITTTVIGLWKKSIKDKFGLIIFLIVAVSSLLTSLSPILYIVCAAAAGIIIQMMKRRG